MTTALLSIAVPAAFAAGYVLGRRSFRLRWPARRPDAPIVLPLASAKPMLRVIAGGRSRRSAAR